MDSATDITLVPLHGNIPTESTEYQTLQASTAEGTHGSRTLQNGAPEARLNVPGNRVNSSALANRKASSWPWKTAIASFTTGFVVGRYNLFISHPIASTGILIIATLGTVAINKACNILSSRRKKPKIAEVFVKSDKTDDYVTFTAVAKFPL